MDYLYKDLKSFSELKVGDSLELRIVELNNIPMFWDKLNAVKCNKIELELKPINDAYGMTQVFRFF